MHSRSHGQCNQSRFETAVFVLPQVLQAFTSQKRRDGVDEMLLRLYNPIIWRGLSAAHPSVRQQAAVLFVDAFPLQDPAAPNVETDALLLKQFTELQRLLEDPVPSVRVVAVDGASRILAEYWDLILYASPKGCSQRWLTDLLAMHPQQESVQL